MENTEAHSSGVATAAVTQATNVDPDAALVRRYLAGDAHAFERLFKKYQTPIFNFVSRMVGGEDAHDLTQDVFCNALRGIHNFRGDSKFSTWLYSIARNVCLNRIRRSSCVREESLEAMVEERPYAQLADESSDVEAEIETRQLQDLVNSILATLPPEQRLLITLRDFEQLSYDEIGQITETSLTNVKSRLHRARMAFKKKFRPYMRLLKEGS